MATVRVYRALLRATSEEKALKLVKQVMYEVAFGARVILLSGPYTTGTLADSIEQDGPRVITANQVFGSVGSKLKYASSVHGGAKVHAIFPKGARGVYRFGSHKRPQLKFFWRKAGRVVYMPHVPGSIRRVGLSHPGQPGKHYLSEPLRRAGRRHGFRVIIYEV